MVFDVDPLRLVEFKIDSQIGKLSSGIAAEGIGVGDIYSFLDQTWPSITLRISEKVHSVLTVGDNQQVGQQT